MTKRILVLGAGLAQVDCIRSAQAGGYTVIALDGNPEAEGKSVADTFIHLDIMDVEAVLKCAREHEVHGVVSYAAEAPLQSVLAVRTALGLPGLGEEPLSISQDKLRQRRCFDGLAQPAYRPLRSREDCQSVSELGFPLIIKPVDSSGSRGVSQVDVLTSVEPAWQAAMEASKMGSAIAESFMEGVEYTVEGISIDGEHHILAISEKAKPPGKYRVATELWYPAQLDADMETRIHRLLRDAYTRAGVDSTPTHSEVIITTDGPKIVEIGCRGGGFYVFSKVVRLVTGYDIALNWTRISAGDPVEPPGQIQRNPVLLYFFSAPPGILQSVSQVDRLKSNPRIEFGFFFQQGERVPELATDGSRAGWAIATADSVEALREMYNEILLKVEFRTES